jgi:eukaryotic-like serine/threonine-protein kinase
LRLAGSGSAGTFDDPLTFLCGTEGNPAGLRRQVGREESAPQEEVVSPDREHPAPGRSPAPAASLQEPFAGTPYRILGRLGRGGMGEVLDAEHVSLRKRVVVKILLKELADDPVLVDRMRLEAQALARLAHPNLVSVLDIGRTPDGRPFVVMERLYGQTLFQALRERRFFTVPEAIEVACQMLAGLGAAHAAGILHRDIKLANLFWCLPVDGRRAVKILDFGLAKVLAGDHDDGAPRPLVQPTKEGVTMGTPGYFSPEQSLGRPVDQRTDLYAAGVVLYALLTGKTPFHHRQDIVELVRAHVFEVPRPPSTVATQAIPPELDRAVLKALAKRPEERFASAAEFSAELGVIHTSVRPRWLATELLLPADGVQETASRGPMLDGSPPVLGETDATADAETLLLRPTPRSGRSAGAQASLQSRSIAAPTASASGLAGDTRGADPMASPQRTPRSPALAMLAVVALAVASASVLFFLYRMAYG